MKSAVFGLIASVLLATNADATLMTDGGFDLATSGTQTSNSPWVLAVNLPDGTNAAAQYQTGFANANNTGVGGTQPPGTGTGVWFRSFEGNQGGTGEPFALAAISQRVVAPADGDYVLDFVAGRETNFTADQFSVSLISFDTGASVQVDLRAAAIPDGNLGGAASGNPGGTPFSLTLPGILAGDTLGVVGLMVNGQDSQIPGGQSAFLDDFSLNLVPEPTTMVLLGMASLCLIGGRKR